MNACQEASNADAKDSAQVSGKKWGPVQFQDKKRTETKSQQRILPDKYIYI